MLKSICSMSLMFAFHTIIKLCFFFPVSIFKSTFEIQSSELIIQSIMICCNSMIKVEFSYNNSIVIQYHSFSTQSTILNNNRYFTSLVRWTNTNRILWVYNEIDWRRNDEQHWEPKNELDWWSSFPEHELLMIHCFHCHNLYFWIVL